MASLSFALGAVDDARLALLAGLSAVLLPALVVSLLARWRPGGALARRPRRAAAARAAATLPAARYAVLAFDYALCEFSSRTRRWHCSGR